MKAPALFLLFLVGCIALIWSCATPHGVSSGVVKDEHGIVIPATPFTKADQTAMNAILAKYNKELYRIDTHVNGQFEKRHGTLQDVYTEKTLAASIAENLKKQGFTRSAIRIGKYAASEGATTNPQHVAGPSASPVGTGPNAQHVPGPVASPVGTGPNAQHILQDKLITELMPILDKYK